MRSIPELIEKLVSNPGVVGLIEYGSACHQDVNILGDYDLFAVLKQRDPDVESLHFYVGSIPVDLGLKTLDDRRTGPS